MFIKKIRYKNRINFDYFEIWLGEDESIFDHENFKIDGKFKEKATCVSTQICPWCVKKYGLYSEVERTPESIEEEIKLYSSENPEYWDCKCGIDGCNNGLANYADIDWKDFEVIDGVIE